MCTDQESCITIWHSLSIGGKLMENMHREQKEEKERRKAEKKEERENRMRIREKLFQLLLKKEDSMCTV